MLKSDYLKKTSKNCEKQKTIILSLITEESQAGVNIRTETKGSPKSNDAEH